MHVGALVTLVAAVHYFYMREFWIQIHSSPILYRYIDWSITVPLQMIEFNLILAAVNPNISSGMFWRLMIGTVLMLTCGYLGENHLFFPGRPAIIGFKTMRFIVTVGWSIYPLGYFFGYLCGSVDSDALNLVYNLADFVNKIAFCLAIWACAKSSTMETVSIDDEIDALEAQKRALQAKK